MTDFAEVTPTVDNYWRAIILFGRNVASYKFALGKALFELAEQQRELVPLEELAVPFARHICQHLARVDTQGTSRSSQFLDTCRAFNRGEISEERLIDTTTRLGFNNVIDAFHVVAGEETRIRFFVDERRSQSAIRLTDDLLRLRETGASNDLMPEVEARWRLVETSWHLNMPRRSLTVDHDPGSGLLVVRESPVRRTDLTGVIDALNGYQKGRCFHCNRPLAIGSSGGERPHVDHFFPFVLTTHRFGRNLDGVWNLVLACQTCNLSKADRAPTLKMLRKLHRRNEYLIGSHHPLRATLIRQTGRTTDHRRRFLQDAYAEATALLVHRWQPETHDELVL